MSLAIRPTALIFPLYSATMVTSARSNEKHNNSNSLAIEELFSLWETENTAVHMTFLLLLIKTFVLLSWAHTKICMQICSLSYSQVDYWDSTKNSPTIAEERRETSVLMLQAPSQDGKKEVWRSPESICLTDIWCWQRLKKRKVGWRRTPVLIPKRQQLTKAPCVGRALLTGDTSSLSRCPLQQRRWTNLQPFVSRALKGKPRADCSHPRKRQVETPATSR